MQVASLNDLTSTRGDLSSRPACPYLDLWQGLDGSDVEALYRLPSFDRPRSRGPLDLAGHWIGAVQDQSRGPAVHVVVRDLGVLRLVDVLAARDEMVDGQPCETAVYEARRAKVAPHGGDVVWDAVVHEVGEVRL